ncbi:hypothetical protein [Bacteroides neonati]|uniref:hypothetical protein n=1 Tax=Bacteroides neonati TaxID=1347393 RepID=UPI0005A882A1|nr:hypothetical protein [Bacteroides neonati]
MNGHIEPEGKIPNFPNKDCKILKCNTIQAKAGVKEMSCSQERCHQEEEECHWFVMRDLKPANSNDKSFRVLKGKLKDVFTPTIKIVKKDQAKRRWTVADS